MGTGHEGNLDGIPNGWDWAVADAIEAL